MANPSKEKLPRRIYLEKIGFVLFLTLSLMAGVMLAALASLQKVYADRIYPGVTLAGIDLSGKTLEEAEAAVGNLLDSLGQTTVPITIDGGESFAPTLLDLGVNFDKDTVLSSLFAIGHASNLWEGVVATARSLAGGQPVTLPASFDTKVLEGYVDKTTAALAKKAENATLKVTNGVVEITPGKIGEEADPEYLSAAITKNLEHLHIVRGKIIFDPIRLEIARSQPDIMDDDLEQVKGEAQAMIGEPITMEFEGKTYTFTKADIGSWLVFPEEEVSGKKTYKPQFDDKLINSYIAMKVAKPIDIKMVSKKVLITTGQVIEEGKDGRSVDRGKLLGEVKGLLASRERRVLGLAVSTIPKTEQQVYPDFTLGLYEGKYIEINLAKQMLYAIEGNTLLGSYLISSGKTWGGYATPTGTWYIKNKIAKAYSRQYNLWMPYWNALARNPDGTGYEGYGIHELPCFNISCTYREGIGHLGTPVSHGCIRLGHNGPAAFIYDWAPVATPVYIHR